MQIKRLKVRSTNHKLDPYMDKWEDRMQQMQFRCNIDGIQMRSTGSFRMNDFFDTPFKSFQKCFSRLILAEMSSLFHDIWWIYAPFNVVGHWKKSIDFQKLLRFEKCCKFTLKILITEIQFYFANFYATNARIFMKC